MGKKKIKVTDLTENDVLIVRGKEYKNLTISYAPGRVNVIGSGGFAESIPVTSTVFIKTN